MRIGTSPINGRKSFASSKYDSDQMMFASLHSSFANRRARHKNWNRIYHSFPGCWSLSPVCSTELPTAGRARMCKSDFPIFGMKIYIFSLAIALYGSAHSSYVLAEAFIAIGGELYFGRSRLFFRSRSITHRHHCFILLWCVYFSCISASSTTLSKHTHKACCPNATIKTTAFATSQF